MKSYLTSIMLFAVVQFSVAQTAGKQIDPYLGIFDIDSCKFDSTCTMNYTIDSASIWQTGIPLKTFFDSGYSKPFAIFTDSVNPYPTNNLSHFEVSFDNNAVYPFGKILSFRHKFNTDTLEDGGFITVSDDGGASWKNVISGTPLSLELNVENMYDLDQNLGNNMVGFSGRSKDWIRTKIQMIWAFPVKTDWPDTLMFRFNFYSDSTNIGNKAGWIIDDIVLSYADLGSGIEELSKSSSTYLYPNPTEGEVHISSYQFSFPITYEAYNILGSRVSFGMLSGAGQSLDLSSLTGGLYLVRLRSQGKESYHRILLK